MQYDYISFTQNRVSILSEKREPTFLEKETELYDNGFLCCTHGIL